MDLDNQELRPLPIPIPDAAWGPVATPQGINALNSQNPVETHGKTRNNLHATVEGGYETANYAPRAVSLQTPQLDFVPSAGE